MKYKNGKIKYKAKGRISLKLKIFIILLVVVGILIGGIFYVFSNINSSINRNDGFDKSKEALGLSSDEKINSSVTNIAIFGIDKRKRDFDTGRSDSVMIVSFDGVHKNIKILSILRDTRLNIPGHGLDKLCHAFSYGGPNLAVKTLNKNFDLDITDYVSLNFTSMINIVDAFGGVTVELKKSQVDEINGIIESTKEYRMSPKVAKFNEPSKKVQLNGAQALSYARIRQKEDEHYRVQRQQVIVDLLLQKLSTMNVSQYPGLLRKLMPYIETSLGLQDILKFIPFVLEVKNSGNKKGLIKDIVPHIDDPNVKQGTKNGVWYWFYDIADYRDKIHAFIYED